jgi:hypothetical protein
MVCVPTGHGVMTVLGRPLVLSDGIDCKLHLLCIDGAGVGLPVHLAELDRTLQESACHSRSLKVSECY